MLIDISMTIKRGAFFRHGVRPVEIRQEKVHNDTVITMPVHTATHIDLVFPEREVLLSRMIGTGRLIDVSSVVSDKAGKVELNDVLDIIGGSDISLLHDGDFIFIKTGWDKYAGTERYFQHPELSMELLEWLVSKKINAVGIDSMGLARDPLHGKYDRFMAENDIYVIENLFNLDRIPKDKYGSFTVYCFPLKIQGVDAIPARVVVDCDS